MVASSKGHNIIRKSYNLISKSIETLVVTFVVCYIKWQCKRLKVCNEISPSRSHLAWAPVFEEEFKELSKLLDLPRSSVTSTSRSPLLLILVSAEKERCCQTFYFVILRSSYISYQTITTYRAHDLATLLPR